MAQPVTSHTSLRTFLRSRWPTWLNTWHFSSHRLQTRALEWMEHLIKVLTSNNPTLTRSGQHVELNDYALLGCLHVFFHGFNPNIFVLVITPLTDSSDHTPNSTNTHPLSTSQYFSKGSGRWYTFTHPSTQSDILHDLLHVPRYSTYWLYRISLPHLLKKRFLFLMTFQDLFTSFYHFMFSLSLFSHPISVSQINQSMFT